MKINDWWDTDPGEIYWMEIRQDSAGLGEFLRAPKAAGGGNSSWSYDLTAHVQPGDRVFHWHLTPSGEPGIVGWSEATGPLGSIDWSWQARGTRGRERGAPTVGPAWNMPLANYEELDVPLTRSALNERHEDVLEVIDDISRIHAKPIYAPFQNYGGRELRAQQAYLTKFPAALVALLFELPVADSPAMPSAPSRKPRASRGQGILADAAKRSALERHAVRMAIEHYRAMGATSIEELGKPYDLRVILNGIERHVEVKGSMGQAIDSVQLTQGEVDHAEAYQPTDLFVVDSISARLGSDGALETSGGVTRIWLKWAPESLALRPTHLRYKLPLNGT
jgi:hypothetical protein